MNEVRKEITKTEWDKTAESIRPQHPRTFTLQELRAASLNVRGLTTTQERILKIRQVISLIDLGDAAELSSLFR